MTFAGKLVRKNETIVLDYGEFRDMRFDQCELVFRGGRPPTLANNEFVNCTWTFEQEAANTASFLKALYHGGAKELVLQTVGAGRGE